MKATIDLVEGAIQQGEKVLVFSCFDAPVKQIAKRFGDAALVLTGATPAAKRQGLVDRFQNDDSIQVLVANIIAGGVGLNLTAARQVVFNDLDWVPANHWQAEDRAYRIGQTQSVNVHYLVGSGTVEEFVQSVLERKAVLVEALLEGRATEMGGDVLAEIERLVGLMSPKLAHLRDGELSDADLQQVLDEARVKLRAEQGDDAVASGQHGDPKLMEEALAMLENALSGPRSERYRVTSNSRPGAYYDLEVVQSDVLCSCPGFEYRGACSHARKLKGALANDARLPAGFAAVGAAS